MAMLLAAANTRRLLQVVEMYYARSTSFFGH